MEAEKASSSGREEKPVALLIIGVGVVQGRSSLHMIINWR